MDRAIWDLLAPMEKVLVEKYNFRIHYFEIPPTDNCEDDLWEYLRAFKHAYDRVGNLLILHYGGHGSIDHKVDGYGDVSLEASWDSSTL